MLTNNMSLYHTKSELMNMNIEQGKRKINNNTELAVVHVFIVNRRPG